jgi:hypothetical protein
MAEVAGVAEAEAKLGLAELLWRPVVLGLGRFEMLTLLRIRMRPLAGPLVVAPVLPSGLLL